MDNVTKNKAPKPLKTAREQVKKHKSLETFLSEKHKKANDFIKKVKLSF
jgi:hypothetical protein